MTSKITLDTYSLRIRELIAINPATQDAIPPNQILTTSTLGEVIWVSTVSLLESVSINGTSAFDIAKGIQPAFSTLSTNTVRTFSTTQGTVSNTMAASNSYITNFPTASTLVSTSMGLGSLGYLSSTNASIPVLRTYELILKQDNISSVQTDLFIANCIDYGSSLYMMGGQMNSTGTTSSGVIKRSFNGYQWESVSTIGFTRVNDIKFVNGYYNTGIPQQYEFWAATGYTDGTTNLTVQISKDGGDSWQGATTILQEGNVLQFHMPSSISTTNVYVAGTTGFSASDNIFTNTIDVIHDTNTWQNVGTYYSTLTSVRDITNDPANDPTNIYVGTSFGLPQGTYAFYDTSIPGYQVSSIFFSKVYGIANDGNGRLMAVGLLPGLDDVYTASNFGSGWQLGEKILDDGDINFIKYINGFWIVGGTGEIKANATGAKGNWRSIPHGLEQVRDAIYDNANYIIVGKPSTLTSSNTLPLFLSKNLSSFTAGDVTITSTSLTISSGTLLANNQNPIRMELFTSTVAGIGSAGYLSTFVTIDTLGMSTLQMSSFYLLQSTPSEFIALSSISTVYALAYGQNQWLAGGQATEPTAELLNRSSNDGITWSPLPKSVSMSTIYSLFYNSNTARWWMGGYVNSAVSTGTLAFTDGNLSNWTTVTDPSIKFTQINAIGASNNSPFTYFAGLVNDTVNPYNLVYHYQNDFTPVFVQNLLEINTIKFDEAKEAIWIAGRCDPNFLITSTVGNIQVSFTNGQSWVEYQVPLNIVYDLAINGSNIVAVGIDNTNGYNLEVAYSQDYGCSWQLSGSVFGTVYPERPKVISAYNKFILTGQQIYESTDGSFWTALEPTVNSNLPALQINSNTCIAAGSAFGGSNIAYRSIDGVQFSTYNTNIVSTQLILSSGRMYIGDSLAMGQSEIDSTISGLGTFGYISTLPANFDVDWASTVEGLGSAGYLSSYNTSTVFADMTLDSLQILFSGIPSFYQILTTNSNGALLVDGNPLLTVSSLQSTIDGLGQLGYQSTVGGFPAWVANLGSSNYISSSQLQSTVVGNLNQYVNHSQLNSTIEGLGTTGYLSTKISSQNFVYITSSIGFEGEILSTSLLTAGTDLSSMRLNLSSFASFLTPQTQLRLDITANMFLFFPSGITAPTKIDNFLTLGDDTTRCGSSIIYDLPTNMNTATIPNLSFLLNPANIQSPFPSCVSLHHAIISPDTADFRCIPPVSSCAVVVLNNI